MSFLDLAESPLLDRRPRIEALLGSFLTQAQGAIDRQTGAGVECSLRPATRSRWTFRMCTTPCWTRAAPASCSPVAVRNPPTSTGRVSAGMVDSEAYGGIAFLGVGLGLAN